MYIMISMITVVILSISLGDNHQYYIIGVNVALPTRHVWYSIV